MHGLSEETSAPTIMEPDFTFRDLRCFADLSDAQSYYFLPSTPDLQRDSTHRPMLTMLDVGSSGYLMFTATWAAPPASVEALRHEIASGHHVPDTSHIRLSFAPVVSPQCHALLGDGTGSFQTLATSDTSRVPPYDAVFNLPLQEERLAHVRSAMRGEQGFLAIEYVAELRVRAVGTATFRADAGELLAWLRHERRGSKSLRELLEVAVELNLATVAIHAPGRLGTDIVSKLFDRVLSEVAQQAPRWIAEGGTGLIGVEASIEEGVPEPVRAFADIGRIVSSGSVRRS